MILQQLQAEEAGCTQDQHIDQAGSHLACRLSHARQQGAQQLAAYRSHERQIQERIERLF
jgi:hypothetical protein